MVTSSKGTYLEIQLKEKIQELGEVVITNQVNKNQPLNNMALSGARMLSVEEARRYAGGMDDPARLASSFAGVSPSAGNNGISIHGNAPHLLQWKFEDVEIPNPTHFADISVLGGGVLSSLSSNILGNSDFYTGAFPAEYGNAVSGVFINKMCLFYISLFGRCLNNLKSRIGNDLETSEALYSASFCCSFK